MADIPNDAIDEADMAAPALGRNKANALGLPKQRLSMFTARRFTLLQTILLITLGGAIGTNMRYWLVQWAAQRWGTTFPYGTLLINLTGSLLIGLVYTLLLRSNATTAPALRLFLGIGVLGGYTTFSSFSYETSQLFMAGSSFYGLLNPLLSVCGGILACFVGITLGTFLSG